MNCKYCGKEFEEIKSCYGHVAQCSSYKNFVEQTLTKEFLTNEYCLEGKSAIEIAEELGYVSANPVINRLRKFGIITRSLKESANKERKKQKCKTYCLEKYGTENVLSNGSIIRNKMEESILIKYGVKNVRQIPEIINKIMASAMETKYRLGLALRPELKSEYRQYADTVHRITSQIYKKFENNINPEKLVRGLNKFHLDHRVSIKFGFDNNIPPEIISHVANLCMLDEHSNISKGQKCSITIYELYRKIEEYERLENDNT